MNTLRFLGRVCLLALPLFFAGPAGAQDARDWCGAESPPLAARTFGDCALLMQPLSGPQSSAATGTLAGSDRSDGAAAETFIVAGSGFACGPDLACNPTTQYCSVLIGGPKGVPPSHSCVDVLDVGPWPTCESIPDIGVGCECAESDGGIRVACTAP